MEACQVNEIIFYIAVGFIPAMLILLVVVPILVVLPLPTLTASLSGLGFINAIKKIGKPIIEFVLCVTVDIIILAVLSLILGYIFVQMVGGL